MPRLRCGPRAAARELKELGIREGKRSFSSTKTFLCTWYGFFRISIRSRRMSMRLDSGARRIASSGTMLEPMATCQPRVAKSSSPSQATKTAVASTPHSSTLSTNTRVMRQWECGVGSGNADPLRAFGNRKRDDVGPAPCPKHASDETHPGRYVSPGGLRKHAFRLLRTTPCRPTR